MEFKEYLNKPKCFLHGIKEIRIVFNCEFRCVMDVMTNDEMIYMFKIFKDDLWMKNCINVHLFLKKYPDIPAPKLIEWGEDYMVLERIPGIDMEKYMKIYPGELNIEDISAQLECIVRKIRGITRERMCAVEGDFLYDCYITQSFGEPMVFASINDFIIKRIKRATVFVKKSNKFEKISNYIEKVISKLSRIDVPIVFSHNDVAPRNIIIREGKIVGIIDWEFAGFYPDFYEYFKYFFLEGDNPFTYMFRVDVNEIVAKAEEIISMGFLRKIGKLDAISNYCL